MNAMLVARVKTFLGSELHYDPYQCNAVIGKMAALARMAGHGLDGRFAQAGLGAGPEARLASRLVTYSTVGSRGTETTEYEIRRTLEKWLHERPASATQW